MGDCTGFTPTALSDFRVVVVTPSVVVAPSLG